MEWQAESGRGAYKLEDAKLAAQDQVTKIVTFDINKGVATFIVQYSKMVTATRKELVRKPLESKQEKKSLFSKLFAPKMPVEDYFEVLQTETTTVPIGQNKMTLQIEITHGRIFARTVSGGNYDFLDCGRPGYLVNVRCQEDDKYLIKVASLVLRSYKFGCQISNHSLSGFLYDSLPTSDAQSALLYAVSVSMKKELEK